MPVDSWRPRSSGGAPEVVHPPNEDVAPEPVPKDERGLIPEPYSTLEVVSEYDPTPVPILAYKDDGKIHDKLDQGWTSPDAWTDVQKEETAEEFKGRPWWRFKRRWAMIGCALLAVIVILGCVLGLRQSGGASGAATPAGSGAGSASASGTGSSSLSVPTGRSSCIDTICPQALASVLDSSIQGSSVDGPVVRMFLRDSNGLIKEASSNPGGRNFSSSASWVSRGGPLRTPPAVIAWSKSGNPTISIFGLSASSAVLTKDISVATGNSQGEFESLGGAFTSPPVLCAVSSERVDVWIQWTRDTGGPIVSKKKYEPERAAWGGVFDNSLSDVNSVSKPGVVCRQGDAAHDVVVFGNETGPGAAAWHRQYLNSQNGWAPWSRRGGSFAAGSHPVLIEVGTGRFDFFGLGTDAALHHWSWSDSDGYTNLESLGGSFVSVPAALVTGPSNGDNYRIDVVAVGRDDGRLKHRARIGSRWSPGWEDLGVVSSSAPTLTRISSSAGGLFLTAVDGSIWYSHIRISGDQANWGKLTWNPLPRL